MSSEVQIEQDLFQSCFSSSYYQENDIRRYFVTWWDPQYLGIYLATRSHSTKIDLCQLGVQCFAIRGCPLAIRCGVLGKSEDKLYEYDH